jgi:hypothetical protein
MSGIPIGYRRIPGKTKQCGAYIAMGNDRDGFSRKPSSQLFQRLSSPNFPV